MEDSMLINRAVLNAVKGVEGGKSYVKNPAEVPQQLVLTATAGAATNGFFLDDACGLAAQLGIVGGANKVQFETSGGISRANLLNFLQTHALVIGSFKFQSSIASQLTNNLKINYTALDGNSKSGTAFSGKAVSEMANNPNLLTVRQPFLLTNNSSLAIPVSGDTCVYTLTMDIIAAVPYGQLDAFLAAEKIPTSVSVC